MNNLTQIQLVFCTCPNQEVAKMLAYQLVEAKLAACITIVPNLTSIFPWEGKIDTAEEVLLILKTTSEAYPQLETALLENHPYDCPEIIGFPVQHSYKGYLQWIVENVSHSH